MRFKQRLESFENSFVGGGTDFPDFYKNNGGEVFSAA